MIKVFLKLALAGICLAGAISCSKNDSAFISIDTTDYIVDSRGGELTIPVTSTGVSDVIIDMEYSSRWVTDPKTGDKIPVEPWIRVSRIIEKYPQSKALPTKHSAIVLDIAPNEVQAQREATVEVKSFNVSKTLRIIQANPLKR